LIIYFSFLTLNLNVNHIISLSFVDWFRGKTISLKNPTMAKSKPLQPKAKSQVKTSAVKEEPAVSETELFPIAGIGASAGGLEALEQFLENIPDSSGLAYVVIQHLDPTQKGMLPELLQRVSKIKVYQAKDHMVVKPNCVYVIPPNKSMSILNGKLYLFEPQEIRGLRLPVDYFLRSLATDRKEHSIGIVLSGMGSDGSEGLRAIKENNGIVMVQEPATAKFDSMPRNAIKSVMVDIVAPANELPKKLMLLLKQMPLLEADHNVVSNDESALDKIIILLRTHTGNDFSFYKKNTLYRRIERRMGVHKIDKIASYITFLQKNPKEVEILFKELLIGVTNFFRDPAVWEKMCNVISQEIFDNLPASASLRAWAAGCSTGEEAYTLAIIFKEALEKTTTHKNVSLQIFATDLDHDAIEVARRGIYPVNIASDVSAERLNRYFVKTEDGYRISTEIREMIVFAQHNTIMHPPFTKIDILSCRNLLIYMDAELQKKILKLFFYSLNNNGIMLLGSSETLGSNINLFKTLDGRHRIYKRSSDSHATELSNFPSSYAKSKPDKTIQPTFTPTENIQSLADQVLLQQFSPPGVLVNEAGDIIYISGRTGKYLEPAAGKANLNIFSMLREGLRNEFSLAFHQAIRKKEPVVLRNLKVGINGGTQTVNITVRCMDKPEPLKGTVMIVFNDVADQIDFKPIAKRGKNDKRSSKEVELEMELQHTREEMQSSVEEMQASQEELKSANEELQSSNEELQSTNEELTSSKEEMQSLNEELQTVNAELQAKIDEFTRVDNDMKNLLNSTDIATLFLDKDLNIRRYTDEATRIFKFIKSDIGRPFTDQASDLIYPEMAEDAHEVLRTLVFKERQIPGKKGQWFSVRIMPYRTFDDRIDGLVITFINITKLKQTEDRLNESDQIERLLFDSSKDVNIKLSTRWKVQEFNQEAAVFFGIKRADAIGNDFMEMFIPEPVRKDAEKEMQKLLNNMQDGRLYLQVKASGSKTSVVEWSVNILNNKEGQATCVLLKAEEGRHGSPDLALSERPN
jgi:two-component system, chemotaxis family, CheB/CheR fusion protein